MAVPLELELEGELDGAGTADFTMPFSWCVAELADDCGAHFGSCRCMVLDLGDTRILRCMMPTMSSPGRESESKQPLEAKLQATLNTIPAHTWYALPSGALTFVSDRTADYLGLPKDHPLRFGIDTGASWYSHPPCASRRPRRNTESLVNMCAHGPCR